MSVENVLKPRRQFVEAVAELDREQAAERAQALRLSHGGDGGRGNNDDGGHGDDNDDFDEEERMAERALEEVKAAYTSLRRKLDLLSEGELLFSGPVTLCPDGSLISEDFELLGDDHEDEVDELIDELAEHLETSGQSVAAVARKIGRSAATLYAWLGSRTEPSEASCQRLEAFLAKHR